LSIHGQNWFCVKLKKLTGGHCFFKIQSSRDPETKGGGADRFSKPVGACGV
jgi:hypothetical protein